MELVGDLEIDGAHHVAQKLLWRCRLLDAHSGVVVLPRHLEEEREARRHEAEVGRLAPDA